MRIVIYFVTKNIHSFRSAFGRELKKVVTSLKSGTSSDDIYVPSLWYYDTLSFIADSEMPREAKSIALSIFSSDAYRSLKIPTLF